MRRGLQNDPLSLVLNLYLGGALLFGRRYEAAEKQLLKTLDMDPNFSDAVALLGVTQWHSGKREEAIAHFEKALAASGGDVRTRCALATYKAFAGRKAEALAELDSLLSLRDKRYVSPVHLSQVYFGLGDLDQAFDLLEKGFRTEIQHCVSGFVSQPSMCFAPIRGFRICCVA